MPCDYGLRAVSRARIKQPAPQNVRVETQAPQIDQELLERLGQNDPTFVDWLQGLDIKPLLAEALKRVLSVSGDLRRINFDLSATGRLVATTTVRSAQAKQRAEEAIRTFAARWQMEVIAIVAQLLGYSAAISGGGSKPLILEGEKTNSLNRKPEYVRVTFDPRSEKSEMSFEHFATEKELQTEEARFLALMQKLGIEVEILRRRQIGQPIRIDVVDRKLEGN